MASAHAFDNDMLHVTVLAFATAITLTSKGFDAPSTVFAADVIQFSDCLRKPWQTQLH